MKITFKDKEENLNIYFDGYIHFSIKKDEIIAFQSYGMDGVVYPYKIEFYTKMGTILLEYEDINIWKKMLKIFERIF